MLSQIHHLPLRQLCGGQYEWNITTSFLCVSEMLHFKKKYKEIPFPNVQCKQKVIVVYSACKPDFTMSNECSTKKHCMERKNTDIQCFLYLILCFSGKANCLLTGSQHLTIYDIM